MSHIIKYSEAVHWKIFQVDDFFLVQAEVVQWDNKVDLLIPLTYLWISYYLLTKQTKFSVLQYSLFQKLKF